MMLRSSVSRARRRGLSLILVVVSLVALLGVLAISLEGGLLLSERRTAQATADAAAQAAAADLYYNHYANFGADPSGSAKQAALTAANYNGYANDGTNTKVTINIPPLSGDHIGKASYAEVIVEYYHVRGFSSLFGTNTVPVRGRAVAVGKPAAAEVGILVLDPSAKSALNASGSATITVKKVPVIVDSIDPAGSTAIGSAAVTAPQFYLSGNYSTTGGGRFYGPIETGVRAAVDPFLYLPAPNPATMTVQSDTAVHYTHGDIVLYPGVYTGGITATGNANITLMPGIYYMNGGGLSFAGNGSLTGNGVMIYNAPQNGNADAISVTGNGSITLSAPTTGIYQGMLLFQDRTSTAPASVSGGGAMNLTGTFYFANAQLDVGGNGAFINGGSQYVSRTLNVHGNGSVTINWDPNKVAQGRLIAIVE